MCVRARHPRASITHSLAHSCKGFPPNPLQAIMVCIRQAKANDLLQLQAANLMCLPENYQFRYYMYHQLLWPQLLHVSENHKGKVVGYVLSKMEEDAEIPHGHITSLAVEKTNRKGGLATKMMKLAHTRQEESFDSQFCQLHVRYTNRAAFHLYANTLKYTINDVEKGYYADGEDAYSMKCNYKELRAREEKEREEKERLEQGGSGDGSGDGPPGENVNKESSGGGGDDKKT